MTQPFIIYALPRSRTTWLSKFLTYGKWQCQHDLCAEVGSVDEAVDFLKQPYTGASCSGLVEAWRPLRYKLPHAKTVAVVRPIEEVKESLRKAGFPKGVEPELQRRWEIMQELLLLNDIPTFQFGELQHRNVCAKIFEYCLSRPLDIVWWEMLRGANIQSDTPQRLSYQAANRARCEAMALDMAVQNLLFPL